MSVGTLPTDHIIEAYTEAHSRVYGQLPRIHFLGNAWYEVNGHPVHGTLLETEIRRLRDLADLQDETQQARSTAKRSALQRLISKLRGG